MRAAGKSEPGTDASAVRAALRISWISIGWSVLTGVTSVALGALTGSLALIGSGVSVLVDLTSSIVLVWRFRAHDSHPAGERVAHLVAASALLALAGGLAVAGVWRLVTGGRAQPDAASVGVAALSIVGLSVIGLHKYSVARRVPSAALKTDGHITMVGATTAGITLVGLALTQAGLAFADALAALVVAGAAGAVGVSELLSRERQRA